MRLARVGIPGRPPRPTAMRQSSEQRPVGPRTTPPAPEYWARVLQKAQSRSQKRRTGRQQRTHSPHPTAVRRRQYPPSCRSPAPASRAQEEPNLATADRRTTSWTRRQSPVPLRERPRAGQQRQSMERSSSDGTHSRQSDTTGSVAWQARSPTPPRGSPRRGHAYPFEFPTTA